MCLPIKVIVIIIIRNKLILSAIIVCKQNYKTFKYKFTSLNHFNDVNKLCVMSGVFVHKVFTLLIQPYPYPNITNNKYIIYIA